MTINTLVWCTIQVTISIMGTPDPGYSTVAHGRVIKAQGEDLWVDFSEYTKLHKYIGHYNNVQLKDYECTKDLN